VLFFLSSSRAKVDEGFGSNADFKPYPNSLKLFGTYWNAESLKIEISLVNNSSFYLPKDRQERWLK